MPVSRFVTQRYRGRREEAGAVTWRSEKRWQQQMWEEEGRLGAMLEVSERE
jgi:hypothetical protein